MREGPIGRRVHVVARHKRLRLAARRGEDTGLRVVDAISEELQREKGMCRAALPQVDFDGVDLPLILIVQDRDEIEREAPDHAFPGETTAHFYRLAHNRRAILGACRELAPEIRLTARTAEHL